PALHAAFEKLHEDIGSPDREEAILEGELREAHLPGAGTRASMPGASGQPVPYNGHHVRRIKGAVGLFRILAALLRGFQEAFASKLDTKVTRVAPAAVALRLVGPRVDAPAVLQPE